MRKSDKRESLQKHQHSPKVPFTHPHGRVTFVDAPPEEQSRLLAVRDACLALEQNRASLATDDSDTGALDREQSELLAAYGTPEAYNRLVKLHGDKLPYPRIPEISGVELAPVVEMLSSSSAPMPRNAKDADKFQSRERTNKRRTCSVDRVRAVEKVLSELSTIRTSISDETEQEDLSKLQKENPRFLVWKAIQGSPSLREKVAFVRKWRRLESLAQALVARLHNVKEGTVKYDWTHRPKSASSK